MEELQKVLNLDIIKNFGIQHNCDLTLARQKFLETVPKVISALSALVGAAADSTNDILEVLRMLAYFKAAFPNETILPHAISRALTLVFS
jgi:hypothetical protein